MNSTHLSKKRKVSRQGFSLIEVVLVTVIVATVFTALVSLYSSTIRFDSDSRNEIIASNLAQEGIEMIRNLRDEAILNSTDWDTWVGSIEDFDGGAMGNQIVWIDSSGNVQLTKDPSIFDVCYQTINSRYANTTGGNCTTGSLRETIFQRYVSIDTSNANQITVKCVVEWKSNAIGGITRNVSPEVVLTNWRTTN